MVRVILAESRWTVCKPPKLRARASRRSHRSSGSPFVGEARRVHWRWAPPSGVAISWWPRGEHLLKRRELLLEHVRELVSQRGEKIVFY